MSCELLRKPHWDRLWHVAAALRRGMEIEEIYEITGIDPWFLYNINEILELEAQVKQIGALDGIDTDLLLRTKEMGFPISI